MKTETAKRNDFLKRSQKDVIEQMIKLEIEKHKKEDYFSSEESYLCEMEILNRLKSDFGYDYEQNNEAVEYFLHCTMTEIWQYYLDNILPSL